MIQTVYLPISVYSTEDAARDALEQDRGHAEQELDDALSVGYSIISSTSIVQDGRTWLVYVLHHPTDRPVEQADEDDLAVLDDEQIERILTRVLGEIKGTIEQLTDAGVPFDVAEQYSFIPPQETKELLSYLTDTLRDDLPPWVIKSALLRYDSQRPVDQNGGAL